MYVKNKELHAIEWVTEPTVATNETFTVASAQMGSGSGYYAKGVVTKRADVSSTTSGSIDMTGWTKNPRISLCFKEDLVDPGLLVGNGHNGTLRHNLYDEHWYNTIRTYAFGEILENS